MIEESTKKTLTEVVQNITCDFTVSVELIKTDIVIYRNGLEIGRMTWNPMMTYRQKQRIHTIVCGVN